MTFGNSNFIISDSICKRIKYQFPYKFFGKCLIVEIIIIKI